MKLAICGKGGSGKSTITALLANEALHQGYRVLVIDADESNSGLYRMLGLRQPPRPLMEFVGGKKGLKERLSQPAILDEEVITLDSLREPYAESSDGLTLVGIGKIVQGLEGCACPMGVLSREFLGKLKLAEHELAVVDMEAGIEHFGRGVDSAVNTIIAVVEPSWESLELAQRIQKLSRDMGLKALAILNKIPSSDIASRLERALQEADITVIGKLEYEPEIAAAGLEGKGLLQLATPPGLKNVIEHLISYGREGS